MDFALSGPTSYSLWPASFWRNFQTHNTMQHAMIVVRSKNDLAKHAARTFSDSIEYSALRQLSGNQIIADDQPGNQSKIDTYY